jgi:hypothetical protein
VETEEYEKLDSHLINVDSVMDKFRVMEIHGVFKLIQLTFLKMD